MQRNYKLLIISLFILNLFSWMTYFDFKYGIPSIFKYILSVFILGVLFYSRFKNPAKSNPEGIFYPVVIVFVLWSIILMILSLLKFDGIFYFQRLFAQPYFFVPYLLPVLLLNTKFNLNFFGQYFRYSFILIIPAIIIQVYVVLFAISVSGGVEQRLFINFFNIGSSFLLLTAHISKKKYISYVIILYYLLWIFMWSVYGRRGALLNDLMLLIFMIILRMRSSFVKRAERMKIYFSGLLLIILIMSFGYLATSTYVFQRGFNKSAFEESRGGVFNGFFYDFRSTSDWIFGRGLDGSVLRSLTSHKRADSIENGFFTILLKGGLIYSIPFVLILLRASYLGFFKSRNDLVKAMASLVLIYLIMMNAFGVPEYNSKYILIWISVSVCFSAEMRNHSDEDIQKAINSRFK